MSRSLLFFPAVALVPLLTGGCPTRDVSALDIHPENQVLKEVPVSSNRNVDILFLVDNSPSMKPLQANLVQNFPKFIDVLKSIPGGLPNVHIGVTSSSCGIGFSGIDGCEGVGDNGLLQITPRPIPPAVTCPTPTGGKLYIEDIDNGAGGRTQNYTGALGDNFTCIAALGDQGCGFEMHLEGVKRALDGTNPQNAGFLRKDAYLAVIVLANEDDCSARDNAFLNPSASLNTPTSIFGPRQSYRCTEFGVTCDGLPSLPRVAADYKTCTPRGDSYEWHPQHYVDFLKTLKDSPNLIVTAVIAGNTAPFGVFIDPNNYPTLKHSCSVNINGQDNYGDPATRLKYFTDQFGAQGTFVSICQADFSDALTQIGRLLARVVGTPCLEGNLDLTDVDSSMPGTQLDCQVSDVRFPGTDHEVQTPIARCAMSGPDTPITTTVPCWWTHTDAAKCPTTLSQTNTAFIVERNGAEPPIGTFVQARCVTLN